MNDLLFFTVAVNGYEVFIPTYIYFANKTNPGSKFEFIVEDVNKVSCIKDWFPDVEIHFRQIPPYLKLYPNGARFALEPETKCKYTYIGDVDIMIIEDILPFHLKRMEQHKLPFDNCLRFERAILSGLHFVETEPYYRATEHSRKKYLPNVNLDEYYLFKICEANFPDAIWKLKAKTAFMEERPIHGIHVSPTRLILKKRCK